MDADPCKSFLHNYEMWIPLGSDTDGLKHQVFCDSIVKDGSLLTLFYKSRNDLKTETSYVGYLKNVLYKSSVFR